MGRAVVPVKQLAQAVLLLGRQVLQGREHLKSR
jgi:hypothetical protein